VMLIQVADGPAPAEVEPRVGRDRASRASAESDARAA